MCDLLFTIGELCRVGTESFTWRRSDLKQPPKSWIFWRSGHKPLIENLWYLRAVHPQRGCGRAVADVNDYPARFVTAPAKDAQSRSSSSPTRPDCQVIASPEYNSIITLLLKTPFDWWSRRDDNPFVGKVAAGLAQTANLVMLLLFIHSCPPHC